MAYLQACANTIILAAAVMLSVNACGGSQTSSSDDGDGETASSTSPTSTTESSTTTGGDGTGDGSTSTSTTAGDGTGDGSTSTSTTASSEASDGSTNTSTTLGDGSSEDGTTTSDGDSDGSASSSGSDTGVDDETCDALASIFDQALSQARQCLAGGTVETDECDEALTVEDLCGCLHAVSDQQPVAAGDATSARVAFLAQCPVPDHCALIDCVSASASGHCELTEHPYGVCQFD